MKLSRFRRARRARRTMTQPIELEGLTLSDLYVIRQALAAVEQRMVEHGNDSAAESYHQTLRRVSKLIEAGIR